MVGGGVQGALLVIGFLSCISVGTGLHFEILTWRAWDPETLVLPPLGHPFPKKMDTAQSSPPEAGRAVGPSASVTELCEASHLPRWGAAAFRTDTRNSVTIDWPGLAGCLPAHGPRLILQTRFHGDGKGNTPPLPPDPVRAHPEGELYSALGREPQGPMTERMGAEEGEHWAFVQAMFCGHKGLEKMLRSRTNLIITAKCNRATDKNVEDFYCS